MPSDGLKMHSAGVELDTETLIKEVQKELNGQTEQTRQNLEAEVGRFVHFNEFNTSHISACSSRV